MKPHACYNSRCCWFWADPSLTWSSESLTNASDWVLWSLKVGTTFKLSNISSDSNYYCIIIFIFIVCVSRLYYYNVYLFQNVQKTTEQMKLTFSKVLHFTLRWFVYKAVDLVLSHGIIVDYNPLLSSNVKTSIFSKQFVSLFCLR